MVSIAQRVTAMGGPLLLAPGVTRSWMRVVTRHAHRSAGSQWELPASRDQTGPAKPRSDGLGCKG